MRVILAYVVPGSVNSPLPGSRLGAERGHGVTAVAGEANSPVDVPRLDDEAGLSAAGRASRRAPVTHAETRDVTVFAARRFHESTETSRCFPSVFLVQVCLTLASLVE